jgi:hypothetical protein
MTFAWYAHLRDLREKPWVIAAMISWGIAFFRIHAAGPGESDRLSDLHAAAAQDHPGGDHARGVRALRGVFHEGDASRGTTPARPFASAARCFSSSGNSAAWSSRFTNPTACSASSLRTNPDNGRWRSSAFLRASIRSAGWTWTRKGLLLLTNEAGFNHRLARSEDRPSQDLSRPARRLARSGGDEAPFAGRSADPGAHDASVPRADSSNPNRNIRPACHRFDSGRKSRRLGWNSRSRKGKTAKSGA